MRSLREDLRSGCLALAVLALAGCTIEVGPPPESDPPLVPESAKAPPPPPQPSEPQAWSRDLGLEDGPTSIDHRELAEGLVASDAQGNYSGQRLTFESAFQEEAKTSEAERLRQRARERAAAAGLPPPPEVSAAPVEEVRAEALPPVDGQPDEASGGRRPSRLPPPPEFPPARPAPSAAEASEDAVAMPDTAAGPEEAAAQAQAGPQDGAQDVEDAAAAAEPEAQVAEEAGPAENASTTEDWSQRNSRLPAPPKFPPAAPAGAVTAPEAAAPGDQLASAAPAAGEAAAASEAQAAAAKFAGDAWDPPAGTILVQVAAVQDQAKVAAEWERLRSRHPAVLQPLRLVVEKAMLGERAVFYRVQAGSFGSQAGAAAACETLVSEGQACFVVVR